MMYLIRITITLKEGMLDPEATAIRHALANLGYPTDNLKSAQQYLIRFEAGSEKEARDQAMGMCERLLANPVIHRYEVEVLR